jgi:hypothetical protein
MRTRKAWTAAERQELVNMVLSGTLTYPEIGERLRRPSWSVQCESQRMGMRNKAYVIRKTKHKHLREPVMRYFLTHTRDETAKKFRLTESEFKSLFTVGYRDPKLAHLRKDTRVKAPWTLDELLFVIRHAGLRPRSWMGKKLGRGGARVIKERLKTFNSGTKWLNGMPKKWAEELWGDGCAQGLKTDAGPTGGNGRKNSNFHFIIVPWVECERLARKHGTPEQVRGAVRAMAKFQRWVHGTKSSGRVVGKLKKGLAA